jgi:POT family proton-dependent oligopeptide transporter
MSQPASPTEAISSPSLASGLINLCLTELAARFSSAGVIAATALFLVDTGVSAATATAILSIYVAAGYLLGLPGGWLADRITGPRRAAVAGAGLLAGGQAVAVVPTPSAVYAGLAVAAVGAGLLRPNLAALVGDVCARRDAGYSVFYAMSAGGWAGAVLATMAARPWGAHAAFAVGAVAMALGLGEFATGHGLGDAGRGVPRPVDEYRRGLVVRGAAGIGGWITAVVVAVAGLTIAVARVAPIHALQRVVPPLLVVAPVSYVATMRREHTLTARDQSRLRAFGPILAGTALFWLVYGQVRPDGWLNPVLLAVLGVAAALLWRWREPPATSRRFAAGLLLIGVLAGLAMTGWAPPPALAEIILAPAGLAVTYRLAPRRYASQLMALWFLAAATGSALGGYTAQLPLGTVYYGVLGLAAVGAGVGFVTGAGRLRTLLAGVA